MEPTLNAITRGLYPSIIGLSTPRVQAQAVSAVRDVEEAPVLEEAGQFPRSASAAPCQSDSSICVMMASDTTTSVHRWRALAS